MMLTGDSSSSAKHIAEEVGIDHIKGDLLPGDKEKEVRKLQEEGKAVIFVGDGIDDLHPWLELISGWLFEQARISRSKR